VPGVEKNLDFGYALRDVGWNVLYFHYRGCWGSEGVYSFDGLLDDVQAATEWATKQVSIEKECLVLLGSSIGDTLHSQPGQLTIDSKRLSLSAHS